MGDLIMINLRAHFHPHLVRAKHAGEHALHLMRKIFLQIRLCIQALVRHSREGAGLYIGGQDVAKIIGHRNIAVAQAGHGIGHQKTNGIDGLPAEHPFLPEIQPDRRGRLARFIHNQPGLGHHHHHMGAFHAANHRDAAGEFALDRAFLVHLLHKVRHADGVFLIKNLITHPLAGGLGQSLARECHA